MAEVTARRCDRCKKLEAKTYTTTLADQAGNKVIEKAEDYCSRCLAVLNRRISQFSNSYKGQEENNGE